MRGADEQTSSLFSYVSCEARVPASHPLRGIRAVVDEALDVLSPNFDGLYPQVGRPSIAPEKLLRALLLQAFYSVRSERQLMEQLDYNLLFRWFLGLAVDAPILDASTFSKNRERFLSGDVAQRLLTAILEQPRVRALMSDEHFSVDGTLIQAWAELAKVPPAQQVESQRRAATSRSSQKRPPLRIAVMLGHLVRPHPSGLPLSRLPPSNSLRPRLGATRSGTGADRIAATRRMPASPTRMPGWRENRMARQASWPMLGMC